MSDSISVLHVCTRRSHDSSLNSLNGYRFSYLQCLHEAPDFSLTRKPDFVVIDEELLLGPGRGKSRCLICRDSLARLISLQPVFLSTRRKQAAESAILAATFDMTGCISQPLQQSDLSIISESLKLLPYTPGLQSTNDSEIRRFHLIFDQVDDPVRLVDNLGATIAANRAASSRNDIEWDRSNIASQNVSIVRIPVGKPDLTIEYALPAMKELEEHQDLKNLVGSMFPDFLYDPPIESSLVIDVQGDICSCDEHIEAQFGYNARSLIGLSIESLIPDFKIVLTNEMNLDESSIHWSSLIRTYGGNLTPVGIRVETGRLHGHPFWVINLRRLTSLSEISQIFRQLLVAVQNSSEAVVMTNTLPSVTYANPAAERDTGYSLASIRGCNPKIFASGQHDPAFYKRMWDRLVMQSVWSGHLVNRCSDGSLIDVQQTIIPVINNRGKIYSYISIWREVTTELQMMDDLVQAERMGKMGQLVGGVFHDFKNVLMAMLMTAQSIYESIYHLGLNELSIELSSLIKTTDEATRLARQMLTLGSAKNSESVQNVRSAISGLIPVLKQLLSPNISLALELETQDAGINLSQGMIEQVVLNLVLNARDAITGTGTVTVRCDLQTPGENRSRTQYVRLIVRDTGHGIPPDLIKRIFEPFFTTKQRDKGSGLGLTSVKHIIESNGGYIEVRSAQGIGTEFILYLPSVTSPEALTNSSLLQISARAGQNETILIIEPDPQLRDALTRILQIAGFTPIPCSDFQSAALRMLERNKAMDMILTEAVIPGMDADEFIDVFTTFPATVPVLILTIYPQESIQHISELKNPLIVLQKPQKFNDLIRAIRSCLHHDDLSHPSD